MRDELVARAKDGDDAAFAALVDLDGDRSYAIAFRILRDTTLAEDAVQQTYLQVWRQLPRLREPGRYQAWLHRLLLNSCYEELRRYRRWKDRITVLPVEGPATSDPYVTADDRDALERAFARLSPERRAVVVLHHHVGMPLAEIAQVVGTPIGTVKSRLHYSLEALRAALAADARTHSEARRA